MRAGRRKRAHVLMRSLVDTETLSYAPALIKLSASTSGYLQPGALFDSRHQLIISGKMGLFTGGPSHE
jgi:hypothetical protein